MIEKKFSSEKLQYFKSKIPNYKGYNLYEILSTELGILISNKEKIKLSTIAKIFLTFNYSKVDLNKQFFFAIGKHKRKDYLEIIDFVRAKFSNEESTFFNFNKVPFKLNLSFKNFISSLKISLSLSNISFKDKFIVASKLCFYKNNIDTLEKISSKIQVKKSIVFSSVHPWEALLLYFFKIRNVPVYSLQHGVYFIYKEEEPIDSILYRNFNADFHLCWGEYTKKEFIDYGIDKNKLLVAGYPRNVELKMNTKIDTQDCIVLLARNVLKKSNDRLIKILKQFVKKEPMVSFYFKLHPSLDVAEYSNLLNNENFYLIKNEKPLKDIFKESRYSKAICVYTTAYYEAYLNGIVGLRYYDRNSELSEGIQDDTFENLHDLEIVYKSIFSKTDTRKKLEYIIGCNKDCYFEILN